MARQRTVWLGVLMLMAGLAAAQPVAEHLVNVGEAGDETAILAGASGREGPNAKSQAAFFRECTFRWCANTWRVKLPVFPDRHNQITIRMLTGTSWRFAVPGQPEAYVMAGSPTQEYSLYVPATVVGAQTSLELSAIAVRSFKVAPDAKDKRELAAAVDWIRIRPVDQIPESARLMQSLPTTPEPDLPLSHRLRGTEARPLVTDVDAYVMEARLMRCNVMTIGPMNGQHFTAFATRDGIPAANMEPDFIPRQIKALHAAGISAIGWLPFNVQDLRTADQCQAARKYPDWTMQFIPWDERSPAGKVGMCVVSSPWRETHAGILKEAAALGLDGVFFDGFYLGGIPHPSVPGCVCQWCNAKFKQETGLDAPAKVDWTDMTFKRWVRWRNEKLLQTARFFRDTMREANPKLSVTINYNLWPFGNKDWETAIPMWSVPDLGVSQHAYTGRPDMEWLMLGFKSRLSHDLNPAHCDIWRTAQPAFKYDGSPEDEARHELTMRTFMLSGLTYGVTPWHGGHIMPAEAGVRIHEAIRQRERFFGGEDLRHIGVVMSQNTHDFYGHLPGTKNLRNYQDGLLGTWLLLTEHHLPFRFVFENQIEAGELDGYKVLLLPNMACVSPRIAERLREFAQAGGRLIVTGDSGAYGPWAERQTENTLKDLPGLVRLPGTPELEWVRQRDKAAARRLLDALAAVPLPFTVEAPKTLVVNATWGPERKTLWLHLLNVSAFYPGGDTGFRGQDEAPVYAGPAASDGDIVKGGKVERRSIPARDVVIKLRDWQPKLARLGITGQPLSTKIDGTIRVPEVDTHEIVVVEF